MVRFVIGPDEEVVPDIKGCLPGRGFWLSARRDMVNTACAKNLFAKAARVRVVAPADLAEITAVLIPTRLNIAIPIPSWTLNTFISFPL